MNKAMRDRLDRLSVRLDIAQNKSLPFRFAVCDEETLELYTRECYDRPPFPGELEKFNRGEDDFMMFRIIFVPPDLWHDDTLPGLLDDIVGALKPFTVTNDRIDNHWASINKAAIFLVANGCTTWERQHAANAALNQVLAAHGIKL